MYASVRVSTKTKQQIKNIKTSCGRVLGALLLLLLADKNENNNNDDDDVANDDDDGEKKATNKVRSFLLAAGVDEATVEQTVKELNWKVRAQRGGCCCCCFCDFVCCKHAQARNTSLCF